MSTLVAQLLDVYVRQKLNDKQFEPKKQKGS